jgi:hypothetical protein
MIENALLQVVGQRKLRGLLKLGGSLGKMPSTPEVPRTPRRVAMRLSCGHRPFRVLD